MKCWLGLMRLGQGHIFLKSPHLLYPETSSILLNSKLYSRNWHLVLVCVVFRIRWSFAFRRFVQRVLRRIPLIISQIQYFHIERRFVYSILFISLMISRRILERVRHIWLHIQQSRQANGSFKLFLLHERKSPTQKKTFQAPNSLRVLPSIIYLSSSQSNFWSKSIGFDSQRRKWSWKSLDRLLSRGSVNGAQGWIYTLLCHLCLKKIAHGGFGRWMVSPTYCFGWECLWRAWSEFLIEVMIKLSSGHLLSSESRDYGFHCVIIRNRWGLFGKELTDDNNRLYHLPKEIDIVLKNPQKFDMALSFKSAFCVGSHRPSFPSVDRPATFAGRYRPPFSDKSLLKS